MKYWPLLTIVLFSCQSKLHELESERDRLMKLIEVENSISESFKEQSTALQSHNPKDSNWKRLLDSSVKHYVRADSLSRQLKWINEDIESVSK
jgi:hypothetical protein